MPSQLREGARFKGGKNMARISVSRWLSLACCSHALNSLDFVLSNLDFYASIDSRTGNRKPMPQLIVRQIEEKVVKKLKQRAGEHGVSMEEEHRRILRESLLGKPLRRKSFKEALLAMPDVGKDEDFERGPQLERPVEL